MPPFTVEVVAASRLSALCQETYLLRSIWFDRVGKEGRWILSEAARSGRVPSTEAGWNVERWQAGGATDLIHGLGEG